MSIVSGPWPWAIGLVSVAFLLAGFDWRDRKWPRHAGRALILAVGVTGLIVAGQAIFDFVPYPFPDRFFIWIGVVVLASSSCVTARRIGRWRRLVAVLAVPLTAMAALTFINANYQYFPTAGSLFGSGANHQTSLQGLRQERSERRRGITGGAGAPGGGSTGGSPSAPDRRVPVGSGALINLQIPAPGLHFHPRAAWVWVPPAYVTGEMNGGPVLMLLAGTPGSPSDWIRAGGFQKVAQSYAAHHNGFAPIVVMPDDNGSFLGDSECVNSHVGAAESYLTIDVPRFMREQFGAPAHGGFAVAGLSEGGMCSAMLALRHPRLFSAFGDYSGLSSPTPTNTVNAKLTARALFNGSLPAYYAHNPATLLREHRYPGMRAYFAVGSGDTRCLQAQRLLLPLARAAGISAWARTYPAGHAWSVWRRALGATFAGLAGSLGFGTRPHAAHQ